MLHIIQNDPEVPPGNIVDNLDVPYVLHHSYSTRRMPHPADVTALIVLGGAMGANDDETHPFLSPVKTFIKQSVQSGIPYLGICLGGQLLASALGARVASHRWNERGIHDVILNTSGRQDPLFRGFPDRFRTFQWHDDSFDIPQGAKLLAASEVCPHQSFRFGARAWGLQFHPEVTEEIIRAWCAAEHVSRERTEEEVSRFNSGADSYLGTARRLLDNFIEAAGIGNT